MKKLIFTLLALVFYSTFITAQKCDTVLAKTYFQKGLELRKLRQLDSSIVYLNKAEIEYKKCNIIEKEIESSVLKARSYINKKDEKSMELGYKISTDNLKKCNNFWKENHP
ncbi:MAG: hypothetical protein CSA05_00725 [Bacteroidia bacterium]|nr:MAG: hypothetical protein CSB01_00480 [Bacteroidia bacterium]PIE86421.1 MAG: hypothetical protein CSA05_00725 [Bacteroidia bacterium]